MEVLTFDLFLESTNDVFLILNAIEIGDQSAIIQNIDDQLAYLVPE